MRPWIKVRLAEGNQDVIEILHTWKAARELSRNMTRAIRLYNALVTGDTCLLAEYFPWTGSVGRQAQNAPRPLTNSQGRRQVSEPLVEYKQQSEEDEIDAALGVGFGSLDLTSDEQE